MLAIKRGADSVLAELTRRVIRVMSEDAKKCWRCEDLASFLKVEPRRVYDVLDAMYVLGCLKLVTKRDFVWSGTLGPPWNKPRAPHHPKQVSVGDTMEAVIRFFENRVDARTRTWRGVDLVGHLQLGARRRVMYDVLAVLFGVGMISPASGQSKRHFNWTPEKAFDFLIPTVPTVPVGQIDIKLPPIRMELIMSGDTHNLFECIFEEDTNTNSSSTGVLMFYIPNPFLP